MKLSRLPIGSTATILSVGGSGALRQHFLDMGLIQGTEVTVVKYAPMGDPIELRIHGYELTIRLEDAENIEISEPHQPVDVQKKSQKTEKHHPGYGEGGKFHNRKEENPLPEGETLADALADLCPGGESELRKDHAVQPADWIPAACGQFPRCYSRPEGRCDPRL